MDVHTRRSLAATLAAAAATSTLVVAPPAAADHPADVGGHVSSPYVDFVDAITYRKQQMSLMRARGLGT